MIQTPLITRRKLFSFFGVGAASLLIRPTLFQSALFDTWTPIGIVTHLPFDNVLAANRNGILDDNARWLELRTRTLVYYGVRQINLRTTDDLGKLLLSNQDGKLKFEERSL